MDFEDGQWGLITCMETEADPVHEASALRARIEAEADPADVALLDAAEGSGGYPALVTDSGGVEGNV